MKLCFLLDCTYTSYNGRMNVMAEKLHIGHVSFSGIFVLVVLQFLSHNYLLQIGKKADTPFSLSAAHG